MSGTSLSGTFRLSESDIEAVASNRSSTVDTNAFRIIAPIAKGSVNDSFMVKSNDGVIRLMPSLFGNTQDSVQYYTTGDSVAVHLS